MYFLFLFKKIGPRPLCGMFFFYVFEKKRDRLIFGGRAIALPAFFKMRASVS